MKRWSALLVLGGVCVPGVAFGDATFRQVMEMKFNMPVGMMQSAKPFPGMSGPTEVVARVKGTRAYSSFGQAASIIDSATDQITLLDTAGKRYSVATMADYLAQIGQAASAPAQGMPEAARQLLQNVQVKVDSHETGRSEKIQGIDASESEILLTMTIPLPTPGGNGMEITGKFHLWKPNPGEAERVPALREMAAYYEHARKAGLDSSSLITKAFTAFPAMGDKMNDLVAAMQKGGGVTLRLQGEFTMPGLAAMMQQAKASGANVPSIPDGPLFEFNSTMKELNTDPVPDSVFQIPEGYQQAPLPDVMKAFIPMAK